jgi:hypothetical protein
LLISSDFDDTEQCVTFLRGFELATEAKSSKCSCFDSDCVNAIVKNYQYLS